MPESATTAVEVRTGEIAIVGVGNLLMGDDGIGPAVIQRLGRESLPANVRLYDAGTALLDVLGELAACERVIIVDACKAGERPGSTYRARLDPRDWPPAEAGHSLHNMGVLHALSLHLLAGGGLGEVVLISMEPAEVTFGKGLSEAVEARLPELIRAVRDEILNDGNPRRGGEE